MKKFEKVMLYALTMAFVYFFVALIAKKVLPMESMIMKTLEINVFCIFGALIVSAMLFFIFPMWSVPKYLGTQNIKTVMDYTRAYKLQYASLCFGFLGIIFLTDAGIAPICVSFVIIFFSVFQFIIVQSNLRKKSK